MNIEIQKVFTICKCYVSMSFPNLQRYGSIMFDYVQSIVLSIRVCILSMSTQTSIIIIDNVDIQSKCIRDHLKVKHLYIIYSNSDPYNKQTKYTY